MYCVYEIVHYAWLRGYFIIALSHTRIRNILYMGFLWTQNNIGKFYQRKCCNVFCYIVGYFSVGGSSYRPYPTRPAVFITSRHPAAIVVGDDFYSGYATSSTFIGVCQANEILIHRGLYEMNNLYFFS
jgi:hypothetical protein